MSHPQNHPLIRTIEERFGGLIYHGTHKPDEGKACLLEAAHVAVGDEWSDEPDRWPDLRPINDAWRDDALRTRNLVPVMIRYWNWAEWTGERRRAVIGRVLVLTVQRIIAELPGLPDDVREQCRGADTLDAAARAARATGTAALAADLADLATEDAAIHADLATDHAVLATAIATEAAELAANVATEAAAALPAARAAIHAVLSTACQLWIEAAEEDPPQAARRHEGR